ncbi:MAG: hypothetical protein ABEI78_00075, partial [Candidatus Nanohaloarchaea archaeon]
MADMQDIKNLDGGEVVFLKVQSERLRETTKKLVVELVEEGNLIIYISFSKQVEKLKDVYEHKGINTKRILFFDCITKTIGSVPDRMENTIFFEPSELTNIQMKLGDAIESVPEGKKGYIIFDSMDVANTYNDLNTLRKFIRSISAKLREWEAPSIFVGLDDGMDDKLKTELEKSSEQTVEMEFEED